MIILSIYSIKDLRIEVYLDGDIIHDFRPFALGHEILADFSSILSIKAIQNKPAAIINLIRVINLIDTFHEEIIHRRPKKYKKRLNPFDLPDFEFRCKYRFSKAVVGKIVNLVKSDLTLNRRGTGTSPELQVLAALRYWERRGVQNDAGDLHGLTQPTVSRICARVARALAKIASRFIRIPANFAFFFHVFPMLG